MTNDDIKNLIEDFQFEHGVSLYGDIEQKSGLWEATIQDQVGKFTAKGKGDTKDEAVRDALDKYKEWMLS